MDEKLRIYVAPKRGRLPRRYEFIGEPHPLMHKGRWVAFWLVVGALFWWGIWRIAH